MSGDLFAGVGPRVLYEASVIFISKTLKYLCRQHGKAIGIEADQQQLADRAIDLIPSFCKLIQIRWASSNIMFSCLSTPAYRYNSFHRRNWPSIGRIPRIINVGIILNLEGTW